MKLVRLSLAGIFFSSSILCGGQTFAEENKSRDVDAQVIFEVDTSTNPTDPVNPLDPEKPVKPIDPIDPENPVNPGTSGPLSIDYASSLNFGKQTISSVDKTYYAKTQKVINKDGDEEYVSLYTQVTDNRGTLNGWSLSVKQNGQFKSGNNELKGAKIEFMNGQITTASESKIPSLIKEKFDLTADASGAATTVVSAKNGEGAGTFIYRLGNEKTKEESVQLVVPGKSIKLKDVQYKTSLTWTLNDVPGDSL